MILLDTHVLVWVLDGDPRLGRLAGQRIEMEFAGQGLAIAAITGWELGMLQAKGRIALKIPLRQWLGQATDLGITSIATTLEIAAEAGLFDDDLHGDPCDRLIVATSRMLGIPLLTADRKILTYAAAGNLEAIDAQR